MRELTTKTIEEVSGAFLANIGAGTAGFISGLGFFSNPIANTVGMAAGGAVDNWIDS